MLRTRVELERLTSIQRLIDKKERDKVSIIGIVYSKKETKNKHIILEIEDPTGIIKVLINKDNQELISIGKDVVLDEVIGVSGTSGDYIIFANNIIFPDVPLGKELKKGPKENYAIFLSDLEVGSKNFLKEDWERFISWLNQEVGDEEQKKIASKVKYLFIVGDLVSGVGIYPGQENNLLIPDIYDQYQAFADYMKQIPSNINIILCLGNHDAGRLAEPQFPLHKDFAEAVYELDNVYLVSNPSMLNIEATEDFEGFDVLLYHGYSMPFFAENVESIRFAGGQKRPDLIMELYLKKRHLAPTHTSNLYVPDTEHDPMVIEKVPDFLATGHIHRTSASNYKGITTMNCSAWNDLTDDQVKRGLVPEPGRAILVNLKSRNVKIMNFYKGNEM